MWSRMRFFLYGFKLPLGFRGGMSLSPRDFRPMPAPPPRPILLSSVYVIATDDGLCKIGVSRNPEGRLAQLQTGCPQKLHIAYVCILADRAYEVEEFAHIALGKKAAGGEWFKCTEQEAIEAVNRSAAYFGKRIAELEPPKESTKIPFWLGFLISLIFILWAMNAVFTQLTQHHQQMLP